MLRQTAFSHFVTLDYFSFEIWHVVFHQSVHSIPQRVKQYRNDFVKQTPNSINLWDIFNISVPLFESSHRSAKRKINLGHMKLFVASINKSVLPLIWCINFSSWIENWYTEERHSDISNRIKCYIIPVDSDISSVWMVRFFYLNISEVRVFNRLRVRSVSEKPNECEFLWVREKAHLHFICLIECEKR